MSILGYLNLVVDLVFDLVLPQTEYFSHRT